MTTHLTHRRRKETSEGTLDQFFTTPSLLSHYASVIETQCGGAASASDAADASAPVFVDTSCGTGELGLLLHRSGYVVHMYDVDDEHLLPEVSQALCDTFTFEKKDWMAVTELPGASAGTNGCIVGFNPPFGYRGKVSREFATHAARLGCATLCWLSSYMLGSMKRPWMPDDFVEQHYELVPNNAFATPGGGKINAASSSCSRPTTLHSQSTPIVQPRHEPQHRNGRDSMLLAGKKRLAVAVRLW